MCVIVVVLNNLFSNTLDGFLIFNPIILYKINTKIYKIVSKIIELSQLTIIIKLTGEHSYEETRYC